MRRTVGGLQQLADDDHAEDPVDALRRAHHSMLARITTASTPRIPESRAVTLWSAVVAGTYAAGIGDEVEVASQAAIHAARLRLQHKEIYRDDRDF
ncbi:hypothetical protein [Mycolicibacterium sphagni]|uniref:hypothetical protein n=1 Tax=Mycolicibacterium sphagni TaxID=1786 RepID=UPI0021F28FDD|nr:hypothetical protein [Mycolicibacterium sphagni]MCV7177565.1 hypothetical protein [Mycolicibacterium sphagni]